IVRRGGPRVAGFRDGRRHFHDRRFNRRFVGIGFGYPYWGYPYWDDYYYGDYYDDYYPATTVVAADGGGMELCARRFRSFDPSSGTYMTYRGVRKVCPYLR